MKNLGREIYTPHQPVSFVQDPISAAARVRTCVMRAERFTAWDRIIIGYPVVGNEGTPTAPMKPALSSGPYQPSPGQDGRDQRPDDAALLVKRPAVTDPHETGRTELPRATAMQLA